MAGYRLMFGGDVKYRSIAVSRQSMDDQRPAMSDHEGEAGGSFRSLDSLAIKAKRTTSLWILVGEGDDRAYERTTLTMHQAVSLNTLFGQRLMKRHRVIVRPAVIRASSKMWAGIADIM